MHGTRASRASTYTDLNRQHRQRSGSQSNLTELGDRRQTYSGVRRSSSVSNLRTPRHTQTVSARSPANRTPSTVTGLTSSSEQYRRLATENTNKVMETLQSNRSFFSRLNLGNGGLKSMTPNHFIEIISFFMVKVAGKNLLSKSRPNNHEDVIMAFIQALNYPYTVNPICFRTPNAHQYFPEVVAILAFLSDLMRDIKKYAAPTDMPLSHCDRLINDEFTHLFSAETRRNYLSYDPDRHSLLDNEGEAKLVNGLIAIKMKIDGLTIEELAAKADKLQQSSEQLQQNLIETDSEKYFGHIEGQFIEKKKELSKLQDVLAMKRKCLKMIMLTYDERVAKLRAKQTAVNDLKEQIDQQKYTLLDIKQLMAKETTIKNSIVMIRGENEAIKVEAADAQVKLARLHKLKFDVIKKFNDFTFRITKKLVQCTTFDCIDVNELTIDPTAPAQTIQTICLRLNQLKERCSMTKQQHAEHIQKLHHQMEQFKDEFRRLQDEYNDRMMQFQNAKQNLQMINQKCTNCESHTVASTAKLQRDIDEKIALKQQLMDDLAKTQNKATDLEAKNIELLEDGERHAHEIIRAKQTATTQMDELHDFIDKFKNIE